MAHIGWRKSHYIDQYYEDCLKLGISRERARDGLTLVDHEEEPHGDWHLYIDGNGKYWSMFFPLTF